MHEPTIVAIGGGGFGREPYDSRLDDYLLSLIDKPRPKIAFLPQATAENEAYILRFYRAYSHRADATWISLFQPGNRNLREILLDQDMIYVGGGNTANMLAIWRVHGVDKILKEAWEAGIVLAGVSAGALCWFESGVTDSFSLDLDPLHDGLGFLSGSFCPHYNGEERRHPVYRDLISRQVLPPGYAADEGVAMRFSGTALNEVVSIELESSAWRLDFDTTYVETPIEARII